jgi:serine/threonine protein kinase
MQRQVPRPTLAMSASGLNSSQASVSVSASQQFAQPALGASYVVSASGAQLRLGGQYQVSSTGAHELNPLTGSATPLGKAFAPDRYELGLAASSNSQIIVRHISELDIDNESLIGQGSSAKVYNVLHKPTGIHVCVKQMHIDDIRHRDEVRRELDSLHKANSRFIVDFYGAFFHNELGVILLVLELMESSFADVIKVRAGKLLEVEVKAFAFQIVHGLHFLHEEHHLMHRDIKPANLLLNRFGAVKIADFGISRGQESADPASVQTFVGSIAYMSPERLKGSSYGYESDIWSVGVALCEAITGLHPYYDSPNGPPPTFWDLLQKLMKQNHVLHESPLKHKPGREHISDEMDKFVARCLTFERESRSSAAQLLDDPWFADMTLDRSETIIAALFHDIQESRFRMPHLLTTEPDANVATAVPCVIPTASDISDGPVQLGSSGQLVVNTRSPRTSALEESKQRSKMLLSSLL